MRIQAISLKALRVRISGSDKLPKDFQGYFKDIPCVDWRGEVVGTFDVSVTKSPDMSGANRQGGFRFAPKSSQHRVFVRCPKCNDLIPAGRIAQHVRRRDHAEAKA